MFIFVHFLWNEDLKLEIIEFKQKNIVKWRA